MLAVTLLFKVMFGEMAAYTGRIYKTMVFYQSRSMVRPDTEVHSELELHVAVVHLFSNLVSI